MKKHQTGLTGFFRIIFSFLSFRKKERNINPLRGNTSFLICFTLSFSQAPIFGPFSPKAMIIFVVSSGNRKKGLINHVDPVNPV
jgi:hypothetical protein